jgi:prepilin-type N-terminal cleavage/methylation domain-containing protein
MRKIRSGFTLSEMIVVIAIILVLMQLLFPVFKSAIGRSKHVACISNMRQIHAALEMYVSDFDEYPHRPGLALFPRYIPSKDIFICPLDKAVTPVDDPSDNKSSVRSTYAWPCIPHPGRDEVFQRRNEDAPIVICTYHARSNVDPKVFVVLRKNGAVKSMPVNNISELDSTNDL